jgi:ABC-type nitrate/sulfonate/bicarbonate transport system substrate-binding protein
MLRILLAVVLLVCWETAGALAGEALKKIRIASKAAGESLVPYVIPQRLGFYREEGFDVEVIVTRGTVTTQVVVSGAVEYSNGGSIPAILGGARLKILQVSTDKPSQYLVVSPKITSMKQLRSWRSPILPAIPRCCFGSYWPKTVLRSKPSKCAPSASRQCV